MVPFQLPQDILLNLPEFLLHDIDSIYRIMIYLVPPKVLHKLLFLDFR